MKTDELIALLADGAELPTNPLSAAALPLVVGILASVALMLVFLGVRPDLIAVSALPAFWIKVGFVAALTGAGKLAVTQLARPGASLRLLPLVIGLPLLLIWALATITLLDAAPEQRAALFWGSTWRVCPFLIALLSLPIFAAVVKVMRGLAPTRLRLAGAGAGFAAGATAALVYCLHCPEIATPFIGFWYVLGILIPTAIGVLAGPRLLRW